jgi:type II secretory pathway component PulJ
MMVNFSKKQWFDSAPHHTVQGSAHHKHQARCLGFTLIELLLYVSLSSVLVFSVFMFVSSALASRVKNQAIAEVEQQGIQVMQTITQALRNADSINSPLPQASAAFLSINTQNPSLNPTILEISGNSLRVVEGAALPQILTNNRVVASGFTVTNYSRANTPGIVRVQFTLSHLNPEGRNELNCSKTFIGSASLRQP